MPDFAAQYFACVCPCQRFALPIAGRAYDSGSPWLVMPSVYDSFILPAMPVYPGALCFRKACLIVEGSDRKPRRVAGGPKIRFRKAPPQEQVDELLARIRE